MRKEDIVKNIYLTFMNLKATPQQTEYVYITKRREQG